MRLRRLEFVVIGVTLAFACFMGGFFAGRSWNEVKIVTVASQSGEAQSTGVLTLAQGAAESVGAENAENPGTVTAAPDSNAGTGHSPEVAGAPRDGDGRININLASQSELMDLPGIGTVLASRIVDYRRQYGNFSRIEDIRNVSGIGQKRYEAIQDKITVG